MKRRFLLAAVGVAVLAAIAGVAWSGLVEEGLYKLYVGDDPAEYAEVTEKVFWIDDVDDPWYGNYVYTYTVYNDRFANPNLWCWGMEDPRLSGATIVGFNTPANWIGNYGCAWQGGNPAPVANPLGWIATVDANNVPQGIPLMQSLDTFWFVSPNPPKKMYDAFAHDGPNFAGATFAVGKVSGPTPEPFTLALLAMGLPLALLARRRRKDD